MKFDLQKEGYCFDAANNVWFRPDYVGISYSDGDAEETSLKAIIDQAEDVSVLSSELAEHCTDWPALYHLSRKRANVLRPFENELRGKAVLEIGAGCGAITRYLGESGSIVMALEGSHRRASIASSRCRGLNNITVIAEAFHQLKPMRRFDVVTLVGVLEYARQFFPAANEDPIDAMLAHAKGFLQPGGILIIAIENQLGLKYFAGFPEDHMGKPMFGIEEHYAHDSVVTFGKRELSKRVAGAGLCAQQWWYPFPDYKLPSLLVSEAGAIPREGVDLTPVIRSACARDPQYPPSICINQERAWRPVVRNGLLGDMANSFVLAASDGEFPKSNNLPLAIHYATDRRPEFTKKVVFECAKGGEVLATQVALCAAATPHDDSPLRQALVDQPFVKGELWQDYLIQIITSPEWDVEHIKKWFQIWFSSFCDYVGIENQKDIFVHKVCGKYFDAIPSNMVVDIHGKAKFIDQEWVYNNDIEVGYIVFRALLSSLATLGTIAKPNTNTHTHVSTLICDVLQSIGYDNVDEKYLSYIEIEREIHRLAIGTSCKLKYEDFSSWSLREVDTLSERNVEVRQLWEKIRHLEMYCANLEWDIQLIRNSKSWKITAPLRFVIANLKTFRQKLAKS